jgi:putative nucleotidyltransferase with HDIG domain
MIRIVMLLANRSLSMWKLNSRKDWRSLEKTFDWVRDMKGVPQDPLYHEEGDVATHTRLVLKALEKMEEYRQLPGQDQHMVWAAALLHDVEKRSTTVVEQDGSITAKGHAKKGAMTVRYYLYTMTSTPFTIREQVVALVRYHALPLFALENHDPAKAVIEASLQVNTKLLAILARANTLGRKTAAREDMLLQIDLFQALCEENDCWGHPRHFKTPNARFQYFRKEETYPDFIPFDDFGSRVILMCGLPGAGKDNYIFHHYRDWPAISLDHIRREHKISPSDKSGNGRVIQIAKEQARVYLRQQQNFVWIATNITRAMREQLVNLFTTYKAYVTIVYIEVPYYLLHAQNPDADNFIPASVIERLAARLEVPVETEAHEVVYNVNE